MILIADIRIIHSYRIIMSIIKAQFGLFSLMILESHKTAIIYSNIDHA